jgi:hypothetical protein
MVANSTGVAALGARAEQETRSLCHPRLRGVSAGSVGATDSSFACWICACHWLTPSDPLIRCFYYRRPSVPQGHNLRIDLIK